MTELEKLQANVAFLKEGMRELEELAKRMSEEWRPGMPDRRANKNPKDPNEQVRHCIAIFLSNIKIATAWEAMDYSERGRIASHLYSIIRQAN